MRIRIRSLKSRRGQAMVEYIIIVALIAIGCLAVFGFFGDVLKKKTAGVVSSLDDDKGSQAQAAAQKDSLEQLKELDVTGIEN